MTEHRVASGSRKAVVGLILACIFLVPVSLPGQDDQDQATYAAKILIQIVSDHLTRQPPKSYSLSETQFNAFLRQRIRHSAQPGLEDAQIDVKGDNLFSTTLWLDLDKIEGLDDSMAVRLFTSMVSGKQTLVVDGTLASERGRATYTVSQATIGSVPVPAVVFSAVLGTVGSNLKPPIDPSEPIDLPYSIESIQLENDAIRIHRGLSRK